MSFGSLRRFALLGLAGLTICGCGGGSTAPPPEASAGATADKILGRPADWSDTRNKSNALYQAGKYAEHIAVLEAFSKAHPEFVDVEIQLGDTWKSDHDVLGPLPARLAKAAVHYREALERAMRATDDFGRLMATDSLVEVYLRQVVNSASLPVAEQRQLVADAGGLADHVLKTPPSDDVRKNRSREDAREIKSRLVEVEARLRK